MASIQEYLDLIKNAIYGKDVRQAIHDGIQQCYYDGKAGSTDLEARQRLDSAEGSITSLGSRMSTAESDIDVLDARVDQIVAPSGEAPSAAEVSDARVGVDGTTYTSLGNAVRGQVTDLNNDLSEVKTDISPIVPVKNKIAFTAGAYIKTGLTDIGDTVNLTPVSNGDWTYAIVDCVAGDQFIVKATGAAAGKAWAFVDSDSKLLAVAEGTSVDATVTAPTNTAKAIFNDKFGTGKTSVIIGDSGFEDLVDRVDNLSQSVCEETINLIDIDFEPMPKNGISAIAKTDGIHMSGTNSDTENITRLYITKPKVFPTGTYTFGLAENIGFGTTLSAYAFNMDTTPVSTLAGANMTGENTFTLESDTTVRFALQITKSANVDGAIVKPMCVSGTTLPSYYLPRVDAVDHYARSNISDNLSVALPVYKNFATVYDASSVTALRIKPIQSGSGTPAVDNVRAFYPITDDMKLYVSGRNIFDNDNLYVGYYRQDDPEHLVHSDGYRTIIIDDLPAGSYEVKIGMDNVYIIRVYYDGTNTNNPKSDNKYSVTTTTNGKFMLSFRMETGYSYPSEFLVSVERVSEYMDNDILPYNGSVNTIAIPNDIRPLYGCDIDIATSKIKVTHNYMLISGEDINEVHISALGKWYVDITCDLSGFSQVGDIYCDTYEPYRQAVGRDYGQIAVTASNRMYIYDERFTDLESAQDILTNDPVTLVYPIKDGDSYSITPVDMDGISGEMDFFVDIGEIAEIKYKTDNQCLHSQIEALRKEAKGRDHLNILGFGQSYSSDSWVYAPFILKNYGITVNLYMYYRGDGSIYRLVQEWNDTGENGYDEWGVPHIRRMFHIDTRTSGTWDDGVIGLSPKMVLELANDPSTGIDHWDVITLQTAPTDVCQIKAATDGSPQKGYQPYVRQAINLIHQSYSKPFALGWFCVYTRILPMDSTGGYPAITGEQFDNRIDALRAAETICKYESFDFVIPAAAAVFSARTNPDLASIDVSDISNLWYRDAVHLQSGIPRYIASLTVVQSLFKKFFPRYSVMGDKTRITTAWLDEKNEPTPGIHGGIKVTDHDELLYELAQRCAVAACEHPFDITPIYSPSDATQNNFADTYEDRYWADDLIDTSNIDDGEFVPQDPDA